MVPTARPKRALLIGGLPHDARRFEAMLAPYNVDIAWQWESTGVRRAFPACDVVIVVSKTCSHSLSGSAREQAARAGVPFVVFVSMARSLEHLRRAGVIKNREGS